jgi:hypothetical protein
MERNKNVQVFLDSADFVSQLRLNRVVEKEVIK